MSAPPAPPVALSRLVVHLGGRPVVREVDLTVGAGEMVALLGTNGSGKTTTMRAALGLTPHSGGEVRLFGTAVERFRDWQRLGYVPQRSSATSGVPSTVQEVVLSGTLARRAWLGLPSRADRRAVAEALDLVGLRERSRDSVTDLSGGQQQRVMIARALAARCDLLVLDEPTAGVDLGSQRVLADLFERLLGEGRSVWLVAHELGPLAPLVDRAVVLRDGAVDFEGRYADSLDEPHAQDHAHHSQPHAPRGDLGMGDLGLDPRGIWGSRR